MSNGFWNPYLLPSYVMAAPELGYFEQNLLGTSEDSEVND